MKKKKKVSGFLIWFVMVSLCILGILIMIFLFQQTGIRISNGELQSTSENETEEAGNETEETSSNEETEESLTEETGILLSYDEEFYISTITDEIFERMDGHSFTRESPVLRGNLRYIHIMHIGTDGLAHEGEIIVNKSIAEDVLEIFYELYAMNYVIEKMALVDSYGADDNASMAVNNSSGFNARTIAGTDAWSNHAYGLAIDINPLYNPCVNGEEVFPASAREYINRENEFAMKLYSEDPCVLLFKKHGFEWGGDWENPKDYMHFEKTE